MNHSSLKSLASPSLLVRLLAPAAFFLVAMPHGESLAAVNTWSGANGGNLSTGSSSWTWSGTAGNPTEPTAGTYNVSPNAAAATTSYQDALFTTTGTFIATTASLRPRSVNITNGSTVEIRDDGTNTLAFYISNAGTYAGTVATASGSTNWVNQVSSGTNDAIYLTGNSNLTFSAVNATGVGVGTLQIRSSGAATNFNVTPGSTLRSDMVINGNQNSQAWPLTIKGGGLVIFGAQNAYTGLTTVESGTLRYATANAISTGGVTVSGGVMDLQSYSDTVGAVTLTGGSIIGSGTLTGASYAVSSGTISAAIAGSVALTKTGTASVTVSKAQYTGSTTVSAGTLEIGAATGGSLNTSGTISVASGATLRVLNSLTHPVTGTGTIAVGPGGTFTASSIGSNGINVTGASGSTATFADTFNTGTLSAGALTLGGYSNVTMSATSTLASTGLLSISGTSNLLTLSGVVSAGNTYTLLSGTGLTNTGSISVGGAAVGNATIALGTAATVGRTTYNFNQTSTALQLAVTGTTYNLTWAGGSSGAWDYSATNWQQDGAGSNIAFVQGDNATLGTGAAIAVDAGGVQAGAVTVANASGSVDLTGGSLTAASLTKNAAGSLTIGNPTTLGAGLTVNAGSVSTSSGGTVSITAGGLSVTGGSLTTGAATTVTAGGLSVSGGSFTSNATTTISASGLNVSAGSAALNNASTITGGITLTGGTTALNAANTVSGAVALSGGAVLSLGNVGGAGSGSFSINNGKLSSSMSSGTLSNAIVVGSSGATIANDNPLNLTGAITGTTNTLTKTGSGTLTISSLSTAGTGDGMTVYTSGGTVVFTGTGTKNFGGTSNFDGPVTFDNTTVTLGANTARLSGSGTITTVGTTAINAQASSSGGTKWIDTAIVLNGTVSLASATSKNLTLTNSISGSGNVTTSGPVFVKFTTQAEGGFSGTMTINTQGGAASTWVTTQALGTGNLVTNANPSFAYGGTAAPLLFKNNLTGTYSGTISGDGVVGSYAAADQRPVFSGSNTYTGGTLIWGSIGYTNASAFGTGTISAQDTSARISNDSGSTLTLANPISIAGGMVAGFTGTGVTQITGTLAGGSDTSLLAGAGGMIDLTQQSSATMSGFSGLTKVGGADAKIWTTGDANFGSSSAIWFIGSTGTSNALVAKASTVSISKPILIGTGSTTDGSTYYATFDTGANTMTITGSLGNNVGDGTNPSAGGVKKIGTGTLIMSGTSTYTLPTTVFEGSLLVNGALLTTGTVSVQAGASLGGYGSVGAVTGAGLIGPGNSPGILSATSVDPAGGLAFAFEFTQANPNYLAVSASGNDVFRLTDSTAPFVASLTSGNQVDVYMSQAAVALGTLTGGFFTDTQVDFLASVSNATFRYFVQNNSGSYTYNGQTYQTLAQYDASRSVTVSTIAAGSGQVTQFVITVPEPSTLFAAGAGTASLLLWRRRAKHAASADADSRLAG